MSARFALFLLPLAALAQEPPAQVDQALRARVTEFFQDFVDSKYAKAFDLVAEQTRDEYFASSKANLKDFKIDEIIYSRDFTRATVNLTVKHLWRVQSQEAIAVVPMSTTWKIENDKWVWYHEVQPGTFVTPMGPSDVEMVMRKPDGTISGLPKEITPEAVSAAAQKILQQSSVDKSQVTLPSDKPSSEHVIFHNGAQGSVGLELTGVPKIPGFSAKLDKAGLNFGEDAVLQIDYQPASDQDEDAVPPPATLFLTVAPFNQRFQVQVTFQARAPK